MKMIWSGWKIKENRYVLVSQFHGNFHSRGLSCRKIKSVFRKVKWCFNASWGLKGLNRVNFQPLEVMSCYSDSQLHTCICVIGNQTLLDVYTLILCPITVIWSANDDSRALQCNSYHCFWERDFDIKMSIKACCIALNNHTRNYKLFYGI